MQRKQIKLSTPGGVRLDGVDQGPADAPTVVFVHGYSDSWTTWELVLDHLPPTLRAVALTMRGHGQSSKPESGYLIGDFAADVLAAMETLGIESATLAGHSMGSIIAERIAVDHPQRVDGLVLVGAFAGACDPALIQQMWDEGVGQMTDPVDAAFAREFQQSCIAGPVPQDFFERIVANSCLMPARAWQGALQGFVDTGVEGRLQDIAAPALLIWGDQDAYAGEADQQRLLGALPDVRLSRFDGVGHCPNWEAPARVASEIAEHVHNAAASLAA